MTEEERLEAQRAERIRELEDQERIAIARGQEAELLLRQGLLKDLLAAQAEAQIQAWRNTAYDAREQREEHYRMLRAFDAVREVLQGVVDEGKLAATAKRQREALGGSSESGR